MKSKLSRRDFLKVVSAGTCGAALHSVLSPAGGMMAFAAPISIAATNRVIVVVNLAGGASYNVAPIYHAAYRDKNRTISYGPTDSIALNPEQGFHPSLTVFKQIFDEGRLALLNSVGYVNPNRSHAESTERWFEGLAEAGNGSQGGWGARMTCQISSLFAGVSLGGAVSLLTGGCNDGRSIGDLNNFGEEEFRWNGAANEWFKEARNSIISNTAAPDSKEGLIYVKTAIENLGSSIQTIQQATNITIPVTFPNSGFGNSCRDAARLVAAGPALGVGLIYLERGGFDTHQNERQALTNNLNDINAGLAAFIQAAKQMGFWDRVVIVTMSEFCRTFENGSAGTDHGHAAPMFVMGGGVCGGVKNSPPSSADMSGDYFHNFWIDYREPFKLATQWAGYNGDLIFPGPLVNQGLSLFC